MKPLSKFFTPPLSDDDRSLFFRCLGFTDMRYRLLETCGTIVLRAKHYQGLEGQALLGTVAALQSSPEPLLLRRHAMQSLTEEPLHRPPSLWEELFPYPFSLVGRLFEEEPDRQLQLTPPALKTQLKLLWDALQSLETRMSETEVSCLWLRGGSAEAPLELPILFHYVRKKRIRVGTAPSLRDMGETYRRGLLGDEALWEHFGTQSAFYYLGLEGLSSGPDFIPSLVDRILRMLEAGEKPSEILASPALPVPPADPAPASSQFEL